jgi:hypothetical protein
VQDSGLLKDAIILDVPDEAGDFSTVLVRRGTDKLREISEAWAEYANQQDDAALVLPLMVLQVPNLPDHNLIGTALDTIFERWPVLPQGCVANVFGEHKTEALPKRQSRPVKRLTALAHELAADGLLPDAGKKAHAEFHNVLDYARDKYEQEIAKARQSVLVVEGKSITTTWMQPTTVREPNGREVYLPRFEKHLLCDNDGLFPEDFNSPEGKTVLAELKREGVAAWYRNPDRPSQDSLGVTYEEGGDMKIVRPDFIFFSEQVDGTIVADIIDPHGIHLADALPKLQGLAKYAAANSNLYRRIEAVAELSNGFRSLNLAEETTRAAVFVATTAKKLYESDAAADYSI